MKNNPCKECIVKVMCLDPCDEFVSFIIQNVDSKEIDEDFYYYSMNMASNCRNDPYLRKMTNE